MLFKTPFKKKRLPRNRGYKLKEILDHEERIKKILEKYKTSKIKEEALDDEEPKGLAEARDEESEGTDLDSFL